MPRDSTPREARPAVPGRRAAAADTVPADTVPADSVLTPRERALERLRGMSTTPIEPAPDDTLAADSAADLLVADSVGGDAVPVDSLAGEAADSAFTDQPVAEDSVRALLAALEGYTTTEYGGESALYRAQGNRLELLGESRVEREGQSLEDDSVLVFFGDRGVACGQGNPVLSWQGDPVESQRVCFDIDRSVGEARGARTQFQRGATWYVRGADNHVYLLTGAEANELYGENASFTSCDLPEPHYVFKARSLKMVEDGMMVARNVTLEFEDVPVFWLPWMVQSTKSGRRSGILMPEFGMNDIVRNGSGYNRHLSNLGFYWAINDYVSAQSTFEWYSGNWTAVEGALNYYWRRQFLRGRLTARRYWRDTGQRDLTISTSNSWEPDERTRIQLSGDYATSSELVRDYSFDPRELNRRITSSGSVNRSFDWGSMTLGVQRQQQISDDRLDMTLPSFGLTLRPITLYSNDDGSLNLTWSGRGQADRRLKDVQEALYSGRDEERVSASASHSLSFGNLSLSQSVDYNDQWLGEKPPVADLDSVAVGEAPGRILLPESTQTMSWSTSVGYQQTLWSGTILTPNLTIGGNQVRGDSTAGTFVAAPNRISAGASLSTTIFGFWPGFAGFSRIRHKISPSLSWQYSPGQTADDLTDAQRRVFGEQTLSEQNRLTLNFNQTFEAKVESDDSVDVEDSVVDDAGAPGEPRRLPQAEKVMLLSLNTSGPFVYDFVSARDKNRGFLTDRVSNSIRSDLLKDLTLNMSHDLFEGGERLPDGTFSERTFKPFLTNLNASFRIDDDFWLFRLLGLAADAVNGTPDAEEEPDAEGVANSDDPTLTGEMDPEQTPGTGAIVQRGQRRESGVRRGVGGWQASLNYSLSRFRPAEDGAQREADQTLSGNMSFEPTEHWSLRWSTSYSFTAGEFNQHVLTLTRDLHRWQANFDFIKAQNGNFMFTFRVQLTDNPDLKVDYDQRSDPSERRARAAGF